MKIVLFVLLLLSFSSKAQINRSAKELARENIQEYLNNKLFKDHTYKTISNGELKPFKDPDPDILWIIEQKVETVEIQKGEQETIQAPAKFKFIFYLNKKMSVVRAERSDF